VVAEAAAAAAGEVVAHQHADVVVVLDQVRHGGGLHVSIQRARKRR
jgi:hypothetical protein